MAVRRLTLLGATGSIGASTLSVATHHPERFEVTALAAHRNWQALRELCRRHRPRYAALSDETAAMALRQGLRDDGLKTEVLAGTAGVQAVAALPEVDTVLAAITGAAGLLPTLAAARAGKRVLLANKEALVMGGALFMETVRSGGATLLPVDSEHNAIFQCLPGAAQQCGTRAPGVRKIILTASGGPFRETPLAALRDVTPEQACAHPVWKMGRKISVDSATMMNKGLEVIEAHWLFGVPAAANVATSRLAKISGAPVLPYFPARRADNAGYVITIHPPLENFPSSDPVADTRRFHELIEQHTHRHP
ncbi:MAG: 1-deoxy-D-xylulose-5-phosphate reductoisomerase, partial [Burkholderiales bacterium]|nr:1-deoxy-D-xylulose-5-phosphate reductoisomerase [Burkholderiales bacterium]